ncbi:MAG TPA: hypothetical protein VH333_18680 [Pseudonocardiaceae bacterium]|nr:hypothetical protein [Pseudonocardiaceae bacterium]
MSTSTLVLVVAVVLCYAARRRARWRKAEAAGRRLGRKWSVVTLVAALMGIQIVLGLPAYADQCGDAPVPERPGAGMVGAIDPPAVDHGDPNSNYGKYSYAGSVWHVFDNNCVLSKTITDPNAVIDTWAGNQLFNVGKNIVGATNSLHYAMLSQDSMLKPLDNAVEKAATTFYDNVYVRWFGPIALLLAIMLFRHIWTGDLASISKRGMWALAGMWLAASVLVLGPVYGEVDSMLLQKTSQIQAGFLPADQVGSQRDTLPDALYDNVVYRNWLRGEFGDPTVPQATQFGPELLDDQAWTKADSGSADDTNKVTAKQNDYKTLPDKLGSAAGFFEGSEGSRTGDGFLAMFQAFAYSLFQLFAKASVLLAQVLLRVLLLAAPVIGLAAMVLPDLLPRVGRAAGAVLFNVLLLSALAGMDALLLNLIFGAGDQLSLLAQMLLASLITIVFFMVGRPLRRMWQMVELSVAAAGAGIPTSPGLMSRLRKRSTEPSPQEQFWGSVRDGGGVRPADADRLRVRPEGTGHDERTGSIMATAQRLDRRGSSGATGSGNRRQLPGSPGAQPAAALPPARPYGQGGPARAVPEAAAPSRIVDSPPVVDRGWDRGEDSFVVPSQVRRSNREGPRRAETEMVAGRPVFVLYRPSRGLEVSDSGWDSRTARS